MKFLNAQDLGGTQMDAEILGVMAGEVDGRPCLILRIMDKATGERHQIEMTRIIAEELTECLGPHPLVEAFFRAGNGLQ